MVKTCALVIGHKKHSPGAVNKTYSMSEFDFNEELSKEIETRVSGVHVQRVYRRTYNSLPNDINKLSPDFIVSLHCNAFNCKATGTEVLYYHRSAKGAEIATVLQKNLVSALGLSDRGIKPITSEDRGGYLLKRTIAPCIIAEPFFIDNDEDYLRALNSDLAAAYATGIEKIAALF